MESNHDKYDNFDNSWDVASYIVLIGGIISGLVVLFFNLGDIFTGLFNPEYGAIREILKVIN